MSFLSLSAPADRAGAILTIDLDAIAANYRILSARMRGGSRCAAVVKADAYGLGVAQVAPALFVAGCRRFFVATIDEGIGLRAILPEAEIAVLCGPFAGTHVEFVAHRLWPVLNSPGQMADWAAYARRMEQPLSAILHVDTGMSRLGLSHAEATALAADPKTLAVVPLVLVMSHLACADQAEDSLNHQQLAAFNAARALFPGVEGSLAASSGIFLGADWHADWTRPGAALYGVRPFPRGPNPMAQVVCLQGKIIQVRDVDAGDTVGYGATHRCERPSRIAVAAAGYADGLFRALSNRGCGYLGEHRVPLVGRVSMDLVAFDVTDAPADLACAGGLLDLIGPSNPLDAVAQAAGTIGYEVLTALGHRYHRVYTGGATS